MAFDQKLEKLASAIGGSRACVESAFGAVPFCPRDLSVENKDFEKRESKKQELVNELKQTQAGLAAEAGQLTTAAGASLTAAAGDVGATCKLFEELPADGLEFPEVSMRLEAALAQLDTASVGKALQGVDLDGDQENSAAGSIDG